jgi:hypothetical protein
MLVSAMGAAHSKALSRYVCNNRFGARKDRSDLNDRKAGNREVVPKV